MTAPSADDLRARLADSDQAVRFNAALELAKSGDPAAAPALIEALSHPSQVVRRRYAGGALSELGAAALPDLRAALDAEVPPPVVAWALARADGAPLERVLAALDRALADGDEHAKADAAWAAAELGSSAQPLAPALARLLADEAQPMLVRHEAAQGLRRASPDGDGAGHLVGALGSGDRWTRRWAAEALGGLGVPAAAAVAPLAARLRDDGEDFAVRVQAAYALAEIGAPRAEVLSALTGALAADEPWLRVFATRALAKLGDHAALPVLFRALDDPARDAREAAVLALGLIADPSAGPALESAVPPLAAMLRGDARFAAGLAADALSKMGRPALESLVGLLSDPRAAPHAARSLALIAEPEAAAALARAGVEPYRLSPADFLLPAPPLALNDADVAAFEARLAAGGRIDGLAGRKADFLRYCAERRGLMIHGSNHAELEVLRPIRWSGDSNAWGNVSAVYADPDGLRPMYFAIVDRQSTWFLDNGVRDFPEGRYYHVAIDAESLRARPWRVGMVYVLPPDSFELSHGQEWVSRAPVRPLASVPVEPRDFPFLDRINASDWRLGGTWPTFEGTPYLDWRRIRPILT